MQLQRYSDARDYFRKALSIFEQKYGHEDLRVAKALEKAGTVECSSYARSLGQKNLTLALSYLDRSFRIRSEQLGNFHIDTVETMNKIARVLMKQKDFSGARDRYYEVLKMREAIFGSSHPCVAISAHMLATAHTRLFQVKAAQFYFQLALKVYEKNGLGRHSFAETIRRDLHDLQCINKTRFEV
jgi:tetratricopeptide (TPR) repeat protein